MEALATQGKNTSHRWAVWALALAISLAATTGIRTMLRWSNDNHNAVDLLSRLESNVNLLSSVEWESMARREVPEDLRETQFAARQELIRIFRNLEVLIADEGVAEIHRLYLRYSHAMEEQFRLVERKQLDAAQRIDDETVDPIHQALIALTGALRDRYSEMAYRSMMLVDIGVAGMLILAAIFTGLLFSRFEQSQRLKQILQVEQNILRQSEIRFRSLVQNSSDVIAIIHPLPPRILFISDSVHRVLGRAPERLHGSDLTQLVHPDDGGKLQRFLADCAFSSGMTYTSEVRVQRGDGTWRLVELLGENRTQDHAIGGIVVTLRDLSDGRLVREGSENETALSDESPSRTLH